MISFLLSGLQAFRCCCCCLLIPFRIPRWLSGKESISNAGDEEMWVWFLSGENPLEEEMATHFSILAWEIPGREEPSGLQSMGSQKSWTRLKWHTHTLYSCYDLVPQCGFVWWLPWSNAGGLCLAGISQKQCVLLGASYQEAHKSPFCPHSQCVHLDGLVKKLFTS